MKAPYQRAKKLLDDVFSMFIRTRDKLKYKGICPICKTRKIEVCFHFLPRGNTAVRWNELNCVGSCRGCNYNEHFTRGQAARDAKFREVHVSIIGEDNRVKLEAIKGQTFKASTAELIAMKAVFEIRMAKGEWNKNTGPDKL